MVQEDWAYTMRRTMQVKTNELFWNGINPRWQYWILLQEIVPGVYLGPYASAGKKMAANLKAAGITHIVCVRFSHTLCRCWIFVKWWLSNRFQARSGEKPNQAPSWGWVTIRSAKYNLIDATTKQDSASTWLLPWLTACWSRSYPRRERAKSLLTSECSRDASGQWKGRMKMRVSQVPDAGWKGVGSLQWWDVQSPSPGRKFWKISRWWNEMLILFVGDCLHNGDLLHGLQVSS